MKIPSIFLIFLLGLFTGCSDGLWSKKQGLTESDKAFEKLLIRQFIMAKPGDVIEIPEGTHYLSRSLTLNVDGVTIRGAGMDKSVLSFKHQIAGAEGLLVNASDFTMEDFAIEDSKGDAVKVNEAKNVIIRRIRTEWTNGPATKNGSYGLYPVQTENTLIEECVSIGASDAGIYVGQSKNVIVRKNHAEKNVAGIEVENTQGADVYDNVAINNTGGILVFNMPNLTLPGHSTRIYNNKVDANNHKNFGRKGTPVASIPAGSGIVINSNDKVEIFHNEITNNDTANIIVSSFYSTNYSEEAMDKSFDPYPEEIYIYGNHFEGGGASPDHLDMKAVKVALFGLNGRFPDILWDGYYNPEKVENGQMKLSDAICIDNGVAGIINLDAGNNFKNVTTDITPHQCHHNKLPPVQLAFLAGAG
ncbi:parallel beta-helix domain-containing protein [Algicola sagamiensis]|uniref:parallel beta-helix domain-containing protein n=1 Tax=Algicola sagamiensis TaxID=163869 RepID=UPI000373B719|nr:parallel beta-helix domain-containing protein [Algicola sagamiensis]